MLTAELSAGLGNRLFALASAMNLSKDCNEPLTIVWDIGNGFGASFQDLFETPNTYPVLNISRDGFLSSPLRYLKSRGVIRKLEQDTTLLLRSGAIKVLLQDENGYNTLRDLILMEKNIHIDAYSYYFPDNELNPKYYEDIKPSKKVLDFAEKDFSRIGASTYGIHIRRTDHVDAIKHSPTQLFVDVIANILSVEPNATFYLASDSKEIILELTNTFGANTIMSQSNLVLTRNSTQGAFCAYTDMLCLSKCRKIYGSYGSTFSVLASLIGKRPLDILYTNEES